jgi:hypothetical protein
VTRTEWAPGHCDYRNSKVQRLRLDRHDLPWASRPEEAIVEESNIGGLNGRKRAGVGSAVAVRGPVRVPISCRCHIPANTMPAEGLPGRGSPSASAEAPIPRGLAAGALRSGAVHAMCIGRSQRTPRDWVPQIGGCNNNPETVGFVWNCGDQTTTAAASLPASVGCFASAVKVVMSAAQKPSPRCRHELFHPLLNGA